MTVLHTVGVTTLLAVLAFISQWCWSQTRSSLPLPPGPPKRWIFGHTLDVPKAQAWLTFRNWCDTYGGLIFLDLPMRPFVVIGTYEVANELLSGKSHIYSSRIKSVMIDLLRWDWALASLPYGQKLRTYRRYFHEHFSLLRVPKYRPVQLEEVRRSMFLVLDQPQQARAHVRRFPGTIIVRVVYGVSDPAKVAQYVRLAVTAMASARRITTPFAFSAEFLQFLKYIPSWLPGGSARRFAEKYRPIVKEMRDVPFDEVKQALADGAAAPSITADLIRDLQGEGSELSPKDDQLARDVTGVAFAGGADTIVSTLESFLVAMAIFPEVQRKAQRELDQIVGSSRLPEFKDLDSLVYVRALTLEALRWMPAVPLGIPHCLTEEDQYNGYRLPKDSVVVINNRAMLHDPEDFPEPELFKPERFLGTNGQIDPTIRDPRTIAFGFGRRTCPGVDFAMSVISIYIASMLHVFEVLPGIDDAGQPVVLSDDFTDDAVISPTTFPRHFKPRSRDLERLVRDTVLSSDNGGSPSRQ